MKSTSWAKSNTVLSKKTIVIVFHEATTGLAYDLKDFLLKQGVEELLFISHPLLYLKENFKKSSRFEYYKNGKIAKKGVAFHWILPEHLLYIKDVLYTLLWCLSFATRFDIYIGIGNLNAFSGYLLRLVRRVDQVIYYVIDYLPQRFQNKLLNGIYHWVEQFVAYHSDWTWNLSPRMIEARIKRWKKNFPHQLVVRHGVAVSRIKRVPFAKVNKAEILFMGVLLKKQGIQLVIQALSSLKKDIPEIRLTIIGKGPYEEELKELVKKLNLPSHVEFLGYIASHEEVENRIAKAAIAIALYNKQYDDFTYYADPGKVKNYLGAGVPVVMTNVPYVAQEVGLAHCGFIVDYKKSQLEKVILRFLSDEKMMQDYRKNALTLAKRFDWNKVFLQALQPVLKKYR